MYDYIRQKIINHFAESEQRRLNRLLSELPLGNRKPSELYYEMKRVAGSTLGDATLKGLWIKRLPDMMQPVVAASCGTTAKLTRVADSIVDAMSANQINVVAKQNSSEIEDLRTAVNHLSRQFEKLAARSRSRSRPQSRPPVRYASPVRPAENNNSSKVTGECWYHKKYARKAQRWFRQHGFLEQSSTSRLISCSRGGCQRKICHELRDIPLAG